MMMIIIRFFAIYFTKSEKNIIPVLDSLKNGNTIFLYQLFVILFSKKIFLLFHLFFSSYFITIIIYCSLIVEKKGKLIKVFNLREIGLAQNIRSILT